MARTVISYIRFSSRKQSLGHSEDRQLTIADEVIAAHAKENWVLDRTHAFTDRGRSGFKGNHLKCGKLGEFIAMVEAGLIPRNVILLIENLDRLTRLNLDAARQLIRRILLLGVDIYVHRNSRLFTASDLDDIAASMQLDMLCHLSHEESKKKSERLQRVWRAKCADAHNKRPTRWCPSWIRTDEARNPSLVPEKAEVARKAIDLALQGLGLGAITRRMNKDRVP